MRAISSLLIITTLIFLPTAVHAQDELPLLPEGKHVSIAFDYWYLDQEYWDEAEERIVEALELGLNAAEIALDWSELEDGKGNLRLKPLREYLELTSDLGLRPYVGISIIDTDILVAPADLMDPDDDTRFRDGLTFESKKIQNRYFKLLRRIAPLIKKHDGFFVCIGNEVDVYLSATDQWQEFEQFLSIMNRRLEKKHPDLDIGASLTIDGVVRSPGECAAIVAASDAAAFTHYLLADDLTVDKASAVRRDIRTLVKMADGKPVLLQEAGCPSGYPGTSYMKATEFKQADYINKLFREVRRHDAIRYVSVFRMADWPDEVVDWLVGRYGVDELDEENIFRQRFREYLRTLGLLNAEDASPKRGWNAFVKQLRRTFK